MLHVDGLSAGHGAGDVVHAVDLRVDEGEVVALVGANGSGKTTLLHAVCGLLRASRGRALLDGVDVLGTPTHELARRGVVLVPAERHLFPRMRVEDHLRLGAHPARTDPADRTLALDLFPQLAQRLDQRAGTLSGGEQQMLALARALVRRPRLLVLDEPSTGLAPALARATHTTLARLAAGGTSVLVAEQQVPLVLEVADRGYVLRDGRVTLHGTAAALADDERVRRAYLGLGR